MFKLNETKYKNALLYLVKAVGKGKLKGKKKLYKLLYYLDFDFFEKFGRPFTGDIYHKIPLGPAPSYLDAIVSDMEKEGSLKIGFLKTGKGLRDTYTYKALGKPNIAVFSKDEREMLNRIVRLYGNKTGRQLEQLTHKEPPYLAVEEGEEIPYELAYYRGTNFDDLI